MSRQFIALASCLDGFDAVKADSARSFGRHTHDQFGIGLLCRGAQHSASGRGPVEARAGDVITVNPGEVHDGRPIGDGGRAWRMLYLDPAIVAQAGLAITEGRPASFELTLPVARQPLLARDLSELFGLVTGRAEPDTALRGEELLLSVLARLCERVALRREPPAPVQCALQRMDDDPAVAVTLQELAALAGLSRFQLLRAFRQYTCLTPHAYLLQRRVQLARRLIRRGMPLSQASAEAGFADQSHMHRIFARSFGLTPGAYAQAAVRS